MPMPVYLDHNATSPMHEAVSAAMQPFLQNPVGNPSSLHSFGRMAKSALESARAEIALLVGCDPAEVVFTSGGTEANNLALKGFVDSGIDAAVVSSRIEHPSILEPLKQLRSCGSDVILLDPGSEGRIDADAAIARIGQVRPQLVSIMYANNETGVIQPIDEIANAVDRQACLVHSDATQAIGKLPLDLSRSSIDAISFSAHKIGGPQGVGVLVSRRKPRQVQISGGPQEGGRRGGTENVAGIVGLGKAAEIARLEMAAREHHLRGLRDLLESRLVAIPGCVIFGRQAARLPNTTFFAIPYYHGETLIMELDRAGFALASGSACHSAVTEPSHVLEAMGVDVELALNAVRVSFGTGNSVEDVDRLVNKIQQLIDNLPEVIRRMAV